MNRPKRAARHQARRSAAGGASEAVAAGFASAAWSDRPHIIPAITNKSRRTPDAYACIGLDQGAEERPITPSLSPAEGERVPFRVGEGTSARSPSFHEWGCVS